MDVQYIKLKEMCDDKPFTVNSMLPPRFVRWNDQERKFDTATVPTSGFSKQWTVDTDRGRVNLSQSQMGSLLETSLDSQTGTATVIGKLFKVTKNNPEDPKHTRYYFNSVEPKKHEQASPIEQGPNMPTFDEEVSLDDFPI